jgi:DNA-directed RNA polymerase specialized sigma24 family protein
MLRKLYDIFSVRPDIFVVQTSPGVSRDEYIARQVWEVFCRASSHCTDRQRIVYSLHELEGVPLSETAEVAYYLPFTVEEALEEARSSVKEELDRYGRISDYNSYVGYLRNIDNQLIDRSKLMNNIMQEIFS